MALRILHEWFGPPGAADTSAPRGTSQLAEHQRLAVERLLRILAGRRGAILADSVGTGKTHIALAVTAHALGKGAKCLMVVPAALQAHWRQHARAIVPGGGWQMVTHTALGRGRTPVADFGLIVVDEAHQFRNPKTRRHRALKQLCAQAEVLLITATPVNNRIGDLHALLELFCADHAFTDLAVPSLSAAFAAPGLSAIDRVLGAVVVRRTREILPELAARFPERQSETISYDFDADARALIDLIMRLELRWNSALRSQAHDLLRLHLLKRLESSRAALHASLTRLDQLGSNCLDLLHAGREPELRLLRAASAGAELQLRFDELLFAGAKRAQWDVSALERDCAVLQQAARLCGHAPDPKLDVLRQRLQQQTGRALVFTQFFDTATSLWLALRRQWRVGLITGGGAWLGQHAVPRDAVVRAFCSRGRAQRNEIDVLIATDLLAEGMNLQAGNLVINYDLPWNPVTLMQRAGRIDRLGSPHGAINIVSVLPGRGLERWLNLVRTLEQKLAVIERTVGTEAGVLGAPASRTTALRALDAIEALRARCRYEQPPQSHERIAAFAGRAEATLVALRQGRRLRLLIVRNGVIEEDTSAAAALISAALEAPAVRPRPFDAGSIERWLYSEQALAQPASTTARAEIMRWLGAHLPEVADRPDLVARVDALTRRLCRADKVTAIPGLDRLPLETGLQRISTGLRDARKTSQRGVEWELVGVLQQRAGRVD